MTICYFSDFIRGLKRYKRITISIFRNFFSLKNEQFDQTIFGMYSFIIFYTLSDTKFQVCSQNIFPHYYLKKKQQKNHIKKIEGRY